MDPFALVPGLFVVAFLGIAALVVAIAVREWQTKRHRRETMATWAFTNGLSFAPADNSLSRLGFELFEKGDGRGWDNVVTGTWQDAEVTLADYWYYEESNGEGGRSKSYRRFSIAIVGVAATVPAVRIGRENVLSRLADHVGFRDIEFESEEFNRRFDVRADDREFAFKLLDARMIDWLLRVEGKHGFEIVGSRLLVYCGQLPVEQVPSLVSAAKAFLERVPRLVWADYGHGKGSS